MRAERRRQLRERTAVEMNSLEDESRNLEQIGPVLDEAISLLEADDRAAILLRFFEQRDFASIGEALGSTADAARMRVNRAVEKLHAVLQHRGVALSGAALASLLAAEAVAAAPAGLAGSIAATALAGTAASSSTPLILIKLISMTKLKATVIGS